MATREELEFVRETLDNVITGAVDPSEVVSALEIVTGMIGEFDGDIEATDCTAPDGQDDAPAAESVPSDAVGA